LLAGVNKDTKQVAAVQEQEQVQKEEFPIITPFCEANLNFVHNELLYILHPRMPVGETVYIENAP
jgi:hypothetical protein